MFPDVTFLGLELYDWCIVIGVVMALVVARIYSDLLKIPARLQNLIYVTAVFAIVGGLGGAILFQSVYNWIETGVFEWRGMTFYGGLICGAVIFLIGYFAVGKKVCGEQPKQYFSKVAGKREITNSAVMRGSIPKYRQGVIFGAIINKQNIQIYTISCGHMIRYLFDLWQEKWQGCFLVVAWDNN